MSTFKDLQGLTGVNVSRDISGKQEYKTAVFSGRFDPPHIGHILTIMDIMRQYSKVVVVVLDRSSREVCNAMEAAEIFNLIFDHILPRIARTKVDVIVNHIHFAEITYSEYDLFLRNIGACSNHTVYLSGNQDVLRNMNKQQIRNRYITRSMDRIYEGTKIRKYLEA